MNPIPLSYVKNKLLDIFFFYRSFGYHSLMRRMPDVFSAIIDTLRTDKFDSVRIIHIF